MIAIAGIVVVVICFCFAVFQGMARLIASLISDNNASQIVRLGNEVDILISNVDNSLIGLANNQRVKWLLHGDDAVFNPVQTVIKQSLQPISDMNIEILVVNKSCKIIGSSREKLIGEYRLLGSQWISKIGTAKGERVLISGYTIEQDDVRTVNKVISIARAILNDQDETIGYVMAEIPIEQFERICNQVPIGNGGFVAILDMDKYVIFNTNVGKIGSQQHLGPTEEEDQQKYYFRTINNKKMLVSDYQPKDARFLVMGFLPYDNVLHEVRKLQTQYTLLAAIIGLVAVLYAYFVSKGITKPMRELQEHMQRLQTGDFSVRIRSKRQDEVGDLENMFDQMVERLETMIDTVYKAQIREDEARFQALTATINPHFLYNTIESISMTAYMNNDLQTVRMIQHLAVILRNSFHSEIRDISVQEEMKCIDSYVSLQSMRKPNQFALLWNTDPSLHSHRMLRNLLQPLVENSIIHGFADRACGGMIEINIYSLGDQMICTVRDNGTGITEERLSLIHAALKGDKTAGRECFALVNIHERLRLAFGPGFGMKIYNSGEGCLVELRMPLKTTTITERCQIEDISS